MTLVVQTKLNYNNEGDPMWPVQIPTQTSQAALCVATPGMSEAIGEVRCVYVLYCYYFNVMGIFNDAVSVSVCADICVIQLEDLKNEGEW